LNILTKGFGTESSLVTQGFGKTLTIIITPIEPEKRAGGGGYIEQPPEQHPFRLIETKAIVVPIRKPNIIVKVNIEELDVGAEHVFTKYNKIRIMFQGIE